MAEKFLNTRTYWDEGNSVWDSTSPPYFSGATATALARTNGAFKVEMDFNLSGTDHTSLDLYCHAQKTP